MLNRYFQTMKDRKIRIAFGCAGEGRGHAARTVALSEMLKDRFSITVFAPSSVTDFISESISGIEPVTIPQIGFYRENHSIRYRKTVSMNLPVLINIQEEVGRIAAQLDSMDIAALVSDFEPLTAIAASKVGIPVLKLNHPGIVLRYFSMKPDAIAAKIAAKLMMPEKTDELICSFYGGDIGPIIREEIRRMSPSSGDYYLVYTKAESRNSFETALEDFPGTRFRLFPDGSDSFAEALAGCRGVICPAGHQMISEALYLGKPVLAFPQKMQFEQRLNSIMLERSGWGMAGNINRIEESLEKFMDSIDGFPLRQTNTDHFLLRDYTAAAANMVAAFAERAGDRYAADIKVPGSIKTRPAVATPA